MKLSDASRYFDRTEATDPTTGKVLFLCQIDNFDDAKRDAGPAYRRIMSVAPGIVMPLGGVIKALGRTWIIGGMEPDGLQELHREKYVIHMATESLNLSTLSGFLAGTFTQAVACSAVWLKDAKQLETSSEMPQMFDITLPASVDAPARSVLWDAGVAYLVMSDRNMASGLGVASSLKLSQYAPITATIETRAYDPVAGGYTAAGSVNTPALKVRWQSLFEYGSQAAERFQEGDCSLVFGAGTVVSTSSKIVMAGVSYQTLTVTPLAGAVAVHARVA